MKYKIVQIPEDLHHQLKLAAILNNKDMRDIVTESVTKYLRETYKK